MLDVLKFKDRFFNGAFKTIVPLTAVTGINELIS